MHGKCVVTAWETWWEVGVSLQLAQPHQHPKHSEIACRKPAKPVDVGAPVWCAIGKQPHRLQTLDQVALHIHPLWEEAELGQPAAGRRSSKADEFGMR